LPKNGTTLPPQITHNKNPKTTLTKLLCHKTSGDKVQIHSIAFFGQWYVFVSPPLNILKYNNEKMTEINGTENDVT